MLRREQQVCMSPCLARPVVCSGLLPVCTTHVSAPASEYFMTFACAWRLADVARLWWRLTSLIVLSFSASDMMISACRHLLLLWQSCKHMLGAPAQPSKPASKAQPLTHRACLLRVLLWRRLRPLKHSSPQGSQLSAQRRHATQAHTRQGTLLVYLGVCQLSASASHVSMSTRRTSSRSVRRHCWER